MLRVLLAFLLLVTSLPKVAAQDWVEMIGGALTAYEEGDGEKAIRLAYQTRDFIEEQGGKSPAYYQCSRVLGAFLSLEGRYEESKQVFREVVPGYKELFGAETLEYAEAADYLGKAHYRLNQYDSAAIFLLDAHRVYVKLRVDIADQIGNVEPLARSFYRMKRYDQALVYFQKAVDLRRELHGPQHPNYASLVFDLGDVYRDGGDYNAAIRQFQIAADIYRQTDTDNYQVSLSRIAGCQKSKGNLQSAANTYSLLLNVIRQSTPPDWEYYANKQIQRAEVLVKLADSVSLRQSVQDFLAVPGRKVVSKDLLKIRNLSLQLFQQNKYLQSAYYLRLIIPYFEQLEDYPNLIDAQESLGTVSKYLKDQKSAAYYRGLVVDSKKHGDQRIYASSLVELALELEGMGEYQQAADAATRALNLYTKFEQDSVTRSNIARTQNILSMAYFNQKQYGEVELLLQQSLETYRDLGDSLNIAGALSNLGTLFATLGQGDKAAEYLNRSAAIRKRISGDKSIRYAYSLVGLGNLLQGYSNRGEEARRHFAEALEIFRAVGYETSADYASVMNMLAYSLMYDILESEADTAFQKVIDIRADLFGKRHPDYAQALVGRAELLHRTSKMEESIVLLEEAISIMRSAVNRRNAKYIFTLNKGAQAYVASGLFMRGSKEQESTLLDRLNKAEALFKEVLQTSLDLLHEQFDYMSEQEKLSFYSLFRKYIDNFNSFAYSRYQSSPGILSDVYNYQLETKGILFQNNQQVRNRILSSNDRDLQVLYNELLSKKRSLGSAYSLSQHELEQENVNLSELEREVNELEKQVSLKSSAIEGRQQSISWRDVQKALKKNEAAIEIVRLKEKTFNAIDFDNWSYWALIITKDSKDHPILARVPYILQTEDEAPAKDNYFEKLGFRSINHLRYYKNSIKYKLRDTISYDKFWGRIGEALPTNISKVYFSPEGVYNKISLSSLYNPKTGKYLADEFDFEIVSSTKSIIRAPARTNRGKVVLVGYPDYQESNTDSSSETADSDFRINLGAADTTSRFFSNGIITQLPGTQKEVREIADILESGKVSYEIHTGKAATEEEVKSINNPRILHLATHGFFLENSELRDLEGGRAAYMTDPDISRNPLFRSGILLAGAQAAFDPDLDKKGEDGVLTAYEAMGLDLRTTELVVLSACETGLGEVKNGEGVFGLQRAFLAAGAQAVIMSLWTVDDIATQKLMTGFYNHWMKTGDKREAFNLAQKDLREQYPEPYYWGAFTLLGN